jgi:hypothetical protein
MSKTPEETKQYYIERMGEELGAFFFYDIILHIARLIEESGRPRGKGKPNLTLRYLTKLIDDKETELKPNVKKLISNAQKKAAFSNDWRNRRIVHKDLQLTMNDAVQPLEDVSVTKVRDALNAFYAVLNAVLLHYLGSTLIHYNKMSIKNGAKSLIYLLYDGLKAREKNEKRYEAGQYQPDDFNVPDL